MGESLTGRDGQRSRAAEDDGARLGLGNPRRHLQLARNLLLTHRHRLLPLQVRTSRRHR